MISFHSYVDYEKKKNNQIRAKGSKVKVALDDRVRENLAFEEP